MAYPGPTPSEHSSGSSICGRGITRAGSGTARRVLIGGAWSYRKQARVSRKLRDRIEVIPNTMHDIAEDKGDCGCSSTIGICLRRVSRRWLPLRRLPSGWSASSGPSPGL